mmetsp:Transcript_39875/g.70129  ORF Transcript_39875/g.70129 Transcript_39875/m.70129 type:complete len:581 (+) Transcript_39875:81-1823(+)
MSLHTVGRNFVEGVSEGVEQVDFFSETTIGACVTCCISVLIWMFFLPCFNLIAVPWMMQWEGTGVPTIRHYMSRAEETYITPKATMYVLDANADGNSTLQEFLAGSKRFKTPPFKWDEEARPVFHDLDSNADGKITPAEFYSHVPSKSETKWHTSLQDVIDGAKRKHGDLETAYKAWDSDSDNQVFSDEFYAGAKESLGFIDEVDAQVDFDQADKDKDGILEPREWVDFPMHCYFRTVAQTNGMPSDSDLNRAMEASILEFMKAESTDLANCAVEEEVSAAFSGRRLETLSLVSNCTLHVGTIARQGSMQGMCQQLPNKKFTESLESHLGGAPVELPTPPPTPPPSSAPAPGTPAPTPAPTPMPTPPPSGNGMSIEDAMASLGIKPRKNRSTTPAPAPTHSLALVGPGPVSDQDLLSYTGKSCIVEGDTAIFVTNFLCDASQADTKIDLIKTGLQDLMQKVTGDIPQMQSVQIINNIYYKNNVTVSAKWEIDTSHGGEYQQKVKAQGWRLDDGTKDIFKTVPLECMHNVKVRQFTQFTVQYYGLAANTVPRGLSLQQEYGLAWTEEGIANFTGSFPYVQP